MTDAKKRFRAAAFSGADPRQLPQAAGTGKSVIILGAGIGGLTRITT